MTGVSIETGTTSTTLTGTGTSLVATTLPSFTYSTTTVAGICTPTVAVGGTVPVLTSVTVTVTPDGSPFTLLAAFSACSLIAFSSSCLSLSLRTVTPSGVTFGNTVTGTFTVSSPFAYLTLVGTVTSVAPTLSFVSGKSASVGSCTVPPCPGVTASFTLAISGLSPSTTYTGSAFEPTTLTVISASFVYLTPSTV